MTRHTRTPRRLLHLHFEKKKKRASPGSLCMRPPRPAGSSAPRTGQQPGDRVQTPVRLPRPVLQERVLLSAPLRLAELSTCPPRGSALPQGPRVAPTLVSPLPRFPLCTGPSRCVPADSASRTPSRHPPTQTPPYASQRSPPRSPCSQSATWTRWAAERRGTHSPAPRFNDSDDVWQSPRPRFFNAQARPSAVWPRRPVPHVLPPPATPRQLGLEPRALQARPSLPRLRREDRARHRASGVSSCSAGSGRSRCSAPTTSRAARRDLSAPPAGDCEDAGGSWSWSCSAVWPRAAPVLSASNGSFKVRLVDAKEPHI